MNRNYEAIKAHNAGTYAGPGAIIAGVFERIGAEWDNYAFTLEKSIDGDAAIVALGAYSGACKKTGKTMSARVARVREMDDGKVVRFEQFTGAKLAAAAMI